MESSQTAISGEGGGWSSSNSEGDGPDSYSDSDTPLRFKVFLDVPEFVGDTRWVLVKTEHDRHYKILMVMDGRGYSLEDGWNLLVVVENLEHKQTLMFQVETQESFHMWINDPSRYTLPVGFSPARSSSAIHTWARTWVVVNPGTETPTEVYEAIREMWYACSIHSPIYVCRVLSTPSKGWALIFNKEYTKLIPKERRNVAMRFIGSNVIIPGAIKTYGDGNARMSSNWPLYAREHNLVFGEVFVCKIVRGPSLWEFIGCCAGRNV